MRLYLPCHKTCHRIVFRFVTENTSGHAVFGYFVTLSQKNSPNLLYIYIIYTYSLSLIYYIFLLFID
nr:MAG TPA: hypothetical protein [Caudoviricetes sp.]